MRRMLAVATWLALAIDPARAAGHDSAPAPFSIEESQADSIRYAVRVTDNNLVGMTITNYGFLGNNFVSRSPSLEYPLGTGYEHLVRGGLWFGASAIDDAGAFTGVVTGTVDGVQGGNSQSATEFTPASREITSRSNLLNNKFYNPAAVSELDLVSRFSDRPARPSSLNNNEKHRPMGILVRQDNYMWSFSDYQHVLFFHFTITNIGPPLANAWVGMYAEFASGSKNQYSNWPPPGTYYNKKWIAYDDSLHLFREHYCEALPVPASCNLGVAPYWIGLKALGVRPGNLSDTTDKKVTLAAWRWLPGDTTRDEDRERYALISSGRINPLQDPGLLPESGDPAEVLAVGPFRQIDPGDSISADFAIVGGAEIADLQTHARTAQRAFDRNYIVPVPPPSPRLRVVARNHALDLYWDDSPESAMDPTSPNPLDFEGYRVYVGEDRLDLKRVAQFDKAESPHDTTGFNTGLHALDPPVVLDDSTYNYKYTVVGVRDGFKYYCAVTSYDLGNAEIEPLESGISQNKTLAIPAPLAGESGADGVVVFPNPYRVEARWDQGQEIRDHYLWFANLPERCTLRIYTLAGDLVFATEFDGRAYHGEGARGIYDPRRELDVDPPTLSGATYGWNLITSQNQAAATGLYLFSVEDRKSGKREVGKFLLVKSDREQN